MFQMEINLKDQIVILDEAHNIEDSTREAASFSISQKQLKDANDDVAHMSKTSFWFCPYFYLFESY